MDNMMRMLTPEDIAEVMRVSSRQIVEWINQGIIKGIKAGKIYRVRQDDFEAFTQAPTKKIRKKIKFGG